MQLVPGEYFKDGAYFCYCAYILRISRYSVFLWVVPTNTGIFLRGLKLCGENRTKQVLLVSKKKIWGNRAFFRDNKASIWNKTPYLAFYFTVLFLRIIHGVNRDIKYRYVGINDLKI